MTEAELTVSDVEVLEFPIPPSGVHHTRGVYNNDSFKDNGVAPEHLRGYIKYNLTMRFGRALFVDGKCVHRGYLNEERCLAVERALVGVSASKVTAPYH